MPTSARPRLVCSSTPVAFTTIRARTEVVAPDNGTIQARTLSNSLPGGALIVADPQAGELLRIDPDTGAVRIVNDGEVTDTITTIDLQGDGLSTTTALPIVIALLVFQKALVRGLTAGAVKG